MEVYRSEEEQIEAIKKWWSENGSSVVIGVLLALSALFGWQAWSKHETSVAESASTAYQSVLEAIQNAENAESNSVENSTVSHVGKKLIEEHASTSYSQLTALLLAKHAVDKNDLEEAAKQLQWVVSASDDVALTLVAKLRLARVLASQDKADEALAILNSEKVASFEASFEELKGDIYLGKGETDKARAAYEKASAASKKNKDNRPLLQMKLDDLATTQS